MTLNTMQTHLDELLRLSKELSRNDSLDTSQLMDRVRQSHHELSALLRRVRHPSLIRQLAFPFRQAFGNNDHEHDVA